MIVATPPPAGFGPGLPSPAYLDPPSGPRPDEALRRGSITRVHRAMAAIVAVLGGAVVMAGMLLLLSGREANRIASARQAELVGAAVRQTVVRIAHDQESVTLWDDPLERIGRRPLDLDWFDRNLGIWIHDYYAHDEVYVVGPSGTAIYAMRDGRRTAPSTYRSSLGQIAPRLIAEIGGAAAHGPLPSDREIQSPGSYDLALVDGHPAIVSVKPMLPERSSRHRNLPAGFHFISVVYLDGRFLDQLGKRFLIGHPAYLAALDRADRPHVSLASRAGAPLGYLVWQPFRPGSLVLRRTAPMLALILLLVCVIVAYLWRRLLANTLQLEASKTQAQHLAYHDPLTGLANRSLLQERVARELAQARAAGRSIAYLYLDLDGFKEVNDHLGHPVGDALIRKIADELRQVVGAEDLVARIGGDEFGILQVDTRGRESAEMLGHRILAALGRTFEIERERVNVGTSIGIAIGPQHADSATELARKADIALYEAKAAGRGRAAFFAPAMEASLRGRREVEMALRDALAGDGQLAVHFQPTFAARTLELSGAEALVRWFHPERGEIPPAAFIPVAEQTGLIDRLSFWVIEQACAAAARWPIERISINLSAVQLRDPTLAGRLLDRLATVGFPPRRLEVEITETSLVENAAACSATIATLRREGVTVALDDFGTGYSSFTHLDDFEVDRLKIDRSFVWRSGIAGEGNAIVKSILELARARNLKVTAEGVETEAQCAFLRKAGCTTLQGYLLGRPMSVGDFGDLLAGTAIEKPARRRAARRPRHLEPAASGTA